VRACVVHLCQIHRHNQNFLFGCTGFGEDLAAGARHKTLAPEFDAPTREFFVPDAIDYGHPMAVG